MMTAQASALTLTRVAQMADGDLVVREMPAVATEREAFLRRTVQGARIDSRAIQPGELFVPLEGAHTDGHEFLAEAFARGAAAALCARASYPRWEEREPGPLVVVDDVTESLQRLARRFRDEWQGFLIGLTGSAGKTTTKELVAAALATGGEVLKTEGNLNNHWGVPLTLLRLEPEHKVAVVEMAMNGAGEIALLAAIARPEAAIVTGAGAAHLGGPGLGTLEGIAREKASIALGLPPSGAVFAAADSPRLLDALRPMNRHLITYGLAPGADVRPTSIEPLGEAGTRFEVTGFPPIRLRLVGRHQVGNALAALAVAREYGLDPAAVAEALSRVRPLSQRMEVRHAHGATLLVDCYNSNPDSARAALETLADWPEARRRIAVLGDMLELGPRTADLHREVGAAARGAELWLVGEYAGDYATGARQAGQTARVFSDKPEVAAALREAVGPGVVALLKASRGVALEDVLAGLEV